MNKNQNEKLESLIEIAEDLMAKMAVTLNELKNCTDSEDDENEAYTVFDKRKIAERNAMVNFEFDKVTRVMAALDWKWVNPPSCGGGWIVPDENALREEIHRLIYSAWKELDKQREYKYDDVEGDYKEMTVGTGGLEVYVWENDRESWVDIRFILTDSNGSSQDVEDDTCDTCPAEE